MKRILKSQSSLLIITILFLFTSFAFAQATKEVEFFPEKAIITDIYSDGSFVALDVEAPKGYTAIRGDGFTDVFVLNKFDKSGEKEQTIPVINLSSKTLFYSVVTYVGSETIQLPDKVLATADHFIEYVKGTSKPEYKTNIWIDERGILVLSTYKSSISYQESYDKKNKNGKVCHLSKGLYIGNTSWEMEDNNEDLLTFKLESFLTEKMGGFSMSMIYSLDRDFNPKSYIEK